MRRILRNIVISAAVEPISLIDFSGLGALAMRVAVGWFALFQLHYIIATAMQGLVETETQRDQTYDRDLEQSPVFRWISEQGPRQAWSYRAWLMNPLAPPTKEVVSQVLLFAPLYLTNVCPNECTYCGFRKSNLIKRTLLSVDESVLQAQLLAAQGHETLDLVTGEILTDPFIAQVALSVRRILAETAIKTINLNLGALTDIHYQTLVAAGAYGYHLYQETYNSDSYFAMHQAGQKRDMAYRLAAPERALQAGFKAIGLAALIGLGPYETDIPALLLHAQYLQQKFPTAKIGFSLPRIQRFEADSGFVVPQPMDDETYLKTVCYVRQQFPRANITVTTRESAAIRNQLLAWGIVNKMSAGVSTKPGGYGSWSNNSLEQFYVSDQRSLVEVRLAVQAAGLRAVTC